MTASASSARPMSTSAAAASARSRGATVRSARASCRRSGPFCVVFHSWMFSELGFAQAGPVAANPIASSRNHVEAPGTLRGFPESMTAVHTPVLTDGE